MANTKSIDLELSSSQYLSRTDANLSAGFPGKNTTGSTGDFSIMGWFNIEQLPSTAAALMGIVFKTINTGGFRVRLNTNDTLFALYNDGSNSTFSDTDNAFFVSGDVGNWVHMAISFDVSAQSIIFYKNASPVADTNLGSDASSVGLNTEPFQIGARSDGSAKDFFDGKIDEFSFWSKVLTPTEITNNYNSGNGQILTGSETGLVSYWRFEDDLTDSDATSGNTLTNNNAATFSSDVPFAGGEEFTKELNESITLVDTVSSQITAKLFTDSITLVDNITNSIGKSITETIALVDSIATQPIMTKDLTENITLADTAETAITGKGIQESITVTDVVNKLFIGTRTLSETITLVVSIEPRKIYNELLSETITLVDSLSKVFAIGRLFKESISVTDKLFGLLNGINMKYNRKYDENADDYVDKYKDV